MLAAATLRGCERKPAAGCELLRRGRDKEEKKEGGKKGD